MAAVPLALEATLASRLTILHKWPRGTSSGVPNTQTLRVSSGDRLENRPSGRLGYRSSPALLYVQPRGRVATSSHQLSVPRSTTTNDQIDQKAMFHTRPAYSASVSNDPDIREELLMLRRMLLSVQQQNGSSSAEPRQLHSSSPHSGRLTTDSATSGQSVMPSGNLAVFLREANTRKLYGLLIRPRRNITPDIELRHTMAASMPPNMFSELLRCLDPFAVNEHCDDAPDVAILPGMANVTPLGDSINIFGTRQIYRYLLVSLMAICNLRLRMGLQMMIHDYIALIRCAGAASDWFTAREIWTEMTSAGYEHWAQSNMYYEFIRARFLTESLYAQHDLMRLRVRPLEFHRKKFVFENRDQLRRLQHLDASLLRNGLRRHGENIHRYDYAEHMTHILRHLQPVHSTFSTIQSRGHTRDERMLAALLVALARTGSVKTMDNILYTYWQISVSWDMETGNVDVSGGIDFPLSSPMRPTAVLLDGIVQAYCTSGAVTVAMKLVQYVSQFYNVAIPDRVWFDLLKWTYCMSSKPARTEWKISELRFRALEAQASESILRIMTAASVRPGFNEYSILIKSFIIQKKYDKALHWMRYIKPMYVAQLREYEDALYEYEEMGKHEVAAGRFYRAANRKWYMWHCIHTWCRLILRRLHAKSAADPVSSCIVPGVLDEFRPFILSNARYNTVSGQVWISEPHVQHRKEVLTSQNVISPKVKYDFWEQPRKGRPGRVEQNSRDDGSEEFEPGIEHEGEDLEVGGREWHSDDGQLMKSSPISLRGQLVNGSYRSQMRMVHLYKVERWHPDLALPRKTVRKWLIQEFA